MRIVAVSALVVAIILQWVIVLLTAYKAAKDGLGSVIDL